MSKYIKALSLYIYIYIYQKHCARFARACFQRAARGLLPDSGCFTSGISQHCQHHGAISSSILSTNVASTTSCSQVLSASGQNSQKGLPSAVRMMGTTFSSLSFCLNCVMAWASPPNLILPRLDLKLLPFLDQLKAVLGPVFGLDIYYVDWGPY